ncbi:MAG: exodeoxyribonuclease VII large subunit [Candidatus Promineofilum sp.]|nr:exodeoxyribonuclease VII large subunit [Promineifilum sp.]
MFPFSPQPSSDHTIWTVGELSAYVRQMFDLDYRLRDIDVSGEISNFTRAASGHLYFTLKDSAAQLKCVMWRSQAERLRFRPAEGDAVIAHGRVSVYEVGGVYQLYADYLQPAGRGDLAAAFERLKDKLAAEGLFDADHKRPIPGFARKIGIVTSADAAALRDILNVLQRRNPLVSVLIAPTLVQGEQAPAQIVRALRRLDARDDIDLILVARGGGSIEDLWAFNDERVARAVYEARHPIISGVGHETDFTITDFVADLRAPTPSAAAELAVPDLAGVRPALAQMDAALAAVLLDDLAARRAAVRSFAQLLALLSPRRLLDSDRQQVDGLAGRLERSVRRALDRQRGRLAIAGAGLSAVSPLATLARGFAIVRDADGRLIRAVGEARPGATITIQVSDGTFGAQVTGSG